MNIQIFSSSLFYRTHHSSVLCRSFNNFSTKYDETKQTTKRRNTGEKKRNKNEKIASRNINSKGPGKSEMMKISLHRV